MSNKLNPEEGAVTPAGSAGQDVEDERAHTGDADREARRRAKLDQLKAELVGGELFSAAEVADVLDVHPRTVNEYVREGKLKALQVGGGWKISERALRAFVRELTTDHAQQQYLGGGGPVTAVEERGGTEPATGERGAGKGRDARRPSFKCSFCGKPQETVRRLIAGPGGVYICSECVALCNEIISKQEREEREAGEEG